MLASSAASGAIGWAASHRGSRSRSARISIRFARRRCFRGELGAPTPPSQTAQRAEVFVPDQATADELLQVMMFYHVLGGEGFAGLPNRYQSFCDLSRLLELGRAILVASCDGSGSQLVDRDSGAPLAASDDPSIVVYRVVFPVAPAAPTPNREP